MKRRPPQELVTVLCRAKAQIEEATELLNWYMAAGNEMTLRDVNQIHEARTQLMRLMGWG